MTEFIPLVDIKKNYLSIKLEIDSAIQNVIDNTGFILGSEVEKFEKNFSFFLNIKYCAGVSSGTSAIELALKACSIGNGDEVITTPHTWVSTAEAISNVNATPIFVDIDKKSFNIDPKIIEEKITKRTKAIVPVHLYGNPADMIKIIKIAKKYKLKVIEDCAQAHGAKIGKKFCGTFGDFGCFSFYPGKNLGAFGDAGGVVSNNKTLINKIKQLRDHGRGKTKNQYSILGTNDRLDGIQAAVLNVKLKYLKKWLKSRKQVALNYDKNIKNSVIKPSTSPNNTHAYHLYVIRVKNRSKVVKELIKNKIDCRIHYPIPIHKQKIYKETNKNFKFVNTDKIVNEIISLPIFPELDSKQVTLISEIINKVADD
tara:strand:+ start:502 stop:1608 length:1107 start_codon:yes stop_codon:yes gene_type:complete